MCIHSLTIIGTAFTPFPCSILYAIVRCTSFVCCECHVFLKTWRVHLVNIAFFLQSDSSGKWIDCRIWRGLKWYDDDGDLCHRHNKNGDLPKGSNRQVRFFFFCFRNSKGYSPFRKCKQHSAWSWMRFGGQVYMRRIISRRKCLRVSHTKQIFIINTYWP